ncbi:MAG: type II secretion system protein, partial [Planctomycetota bacterium]|nr:type II secretion system protein [Planctomycetota bacterium]
MTTTPTTDRLALRSRGFTLVEILVVIGIIAVLAAILVPALSTARANALWATSQSNLKQTFTYLQAYTTANRDMIPPSRFDYTNNFVRGRIRSPEERGGSTVQPPIGSAHMGTWADILWSDGGLGGVAVVLPSGEEYNWVHDSPDRLLYEAQPDFSKNPFRSSVTMSKPFNEDEMSTEEATPYGTGAAESQEQSHLGYFAANDFFD